MNIIKYKVRDTNSVLHLDPRWIELAMQKDNHFEILKWAYEQGMFMCCNVIKTLAYNHNSEKILLWLKCRGVNDEQPRVWYEEKYFSVNKSDEVRSWLIRNGCTHDCRHQYKLSKYLGELITLNSQIASQKQMARQVRLQNAWIELNETWKHKPAFLRYLNSYDKRPDKWPTLICQIMAACNEFEILKWCVQEKGYRLTKTTGKYAARNGNLYMLMWLRCLKCPWDHECYYEASSQGNVTMMEWILSNGGKWTYEAFEAAVQNDRFAAVNWILRERFETVFDKQNFFPDSKWISPKMRRLLKKWKIIKEIQRVLSESG